LTAGHSEVELLKAESPSVDAVGLMASGKALFSGRIKPRTVCSRTDCGRSAAL